jgi:hypothetical protein
MSTLFNRCLGSIPLVVLAAAGPATHARAADLQPQTVASFENYVRVTEGQMARAGTFLRVDALPDAERAMKLGTLKRGELVIERLETRDGEKRINTPGGMTHHWIGVVFVPGATVREAVALLQDYDRHGEIYRPAVARSKLLGRNGDLFRVYLRFFMKKGITVVVNSEHEARFTYFGSDRARSRIHSVRIAEVEDADTPREREKPVGRDGGYLWRLNSYWSFVERDGGVYVQCESISLTRGIPIGLGWLIGPFVTSIPRESLEFTLETTRTTLARQTKQMR